MSSVRIVTGRTTPTCIVSGRSSRRTTTVADVTPIGSTDLQRPADRAVGLDERQVEVGVEVHDGAGRGAPVGGRQFDGRRAGNDVRRRQDEAGTDHRALAEMVDRAAAGNAQLYGGFHR